MIIKDLYDKANAVFAISQADFLTAFNEAVLQVASKYGEESVFSNGILSEAAGVDDNLPIFAAWKPCFLHYILYLKAGDALRKSEYDVLVEEAYRTVWKKKMRGRSRYRAATWY